MGGNRITRETRNLLVQHFPLAFMPAGAPKRPLALWIGDHVALALPEIGRTRLANALFDYTSGPTYLRACVEGAARIGLDGKEAGVVTAAQAAYAASRIAAMEENERRQKAQNEANKRAAA